jgi:hypothetical protein
MFKVALTEGWLDIMWKPVDDPVKGHTVYTVFFITFIFVGSFFLLNLFDGIVIDNYYREKEKVLGINDFSSGQRLWIQLQSKVGTQKPKFEVMVPKNKYQACIYKFVMSVYFESFIILVIVINMFVFMIKTHREDPTITGYIADFNSIVLYLFIFEFIIKIACMEFGYFKDGWNIFDFSILVISILTTLFSDTVDFGS